MLSQTTTQETQTHSKKDGVVDGGDHDAVDLQQVGIASRRDAGHSTGAVHEIHECRWRAARMMPNNVSCTPHFNPALSHYAEAPSMDKTCTSVPGTYFWGLGSPGKETYSVLPENATSYGEVSPVAKVKRLPVTRSKVRICPRANCCTTQISEIRHLPPRAHTKSTANKCLWLHLTAPFPESQT